jgi:hypothetical protein
MVLGDGRLHDRGACLLHGQKHSRCQLRFLARGCAVLTAEPAAAVLWNHPRVTFSHVVSAA